MSRIFRRGELKQAIVHVLASVGEAHGYAIMGELEARIGGGWKPSPGAIYPALLGLVEAGHLEISERDGVQVYALTDSGRHLAESSEWARRWSSLNARAEESENRLAVGSLLDRFAASSAVRRRLAGPSQQARIESILARTQMEIEESLEEGEKEDG
ncbi:MAG TPA: PadR family transcriptional regulator [Acidimicrobiia bacterium]